MITGRRGRRPPTSVALREGIAKSNVGVVGRGVPTRREMEVKFYNGASRTPPPTGDALHEGIAKSDVGVVGRGVPTRRDEEFNVGVVGRGVPTRREMEVKFYNGASRTPPPTGDVLHEGIAKSNVGVVGRGVPTR